MKQCFTLYFFFYSLLLFLQALFLLRLSKGEANNKNKYSQVCLRLNEGMETCCFPDKSSSSSNCTEQYFLQAIPHSLLFISPSRRTDCQTSEQISRQNRQNKAKFWNIQNFSISEIQYFILTFTQESSLN